MNIKRAGLIAGGIVALLLVGLVTVPFLVPKEVYRAQIERAATQALQRQITLTGDVKISIFPSIAASVGGVTVANPEGFDGPYMVEAGELRGSVRLMPLLSRRVEVKELAFVDARVSLQKLANGQTNWVFTPAEPTQPAPTRPAGEQKGFNGGVEQARLENASLTYRDGETGEYYELRDLDLLASMASTDEPFRLKAKGFFQAHAFEINSTVDTIDALTKELPADIKADLDTTFGKVHYAGSVKLGTIPVISGQFRASSDSLPQLAALTGADVPFDLSKLGKINLEGSLEGPANALRVDIEKLTQTSDLARTSFAGQLNLSETPTISGELSLDAPSLADLVRFADIEMPVNLTPLGGADIKGTISGALMQPDLTFEKLGVKGELINANYAGTIQLGEVPSLKGALELRSPDAGELARQLEFDLPASGALGKVDLTSAISGPVDALVLSGLEFNQESELLTASYTGDVGLGGEGSLKGQLSAASTRLRDLLAAAEVEMAPGSTLQSFSAKGQASGTFTKISLSALDLKLDNITAKGTAGIDLTGERPRLTGNLDMGALDLSPFLAPADQKPQEPQPLEAWSKDKLDLAGLQAADADLTIKTSKLTLGSVELTDAAMSTKLNAGKLTTDLSQFKAFGGNWKGQMVVDAASQVPAVNLAMEGNSVAISSLLGTLAGFDKLTGTGAFQVNASSRGTSIDEIMRGLDGELSTNLNEGALKGLNVTQLVRSAQSLQQAVTTGNLNNLDFRSVLSPAAETEFTTFNTVLSMQNGVATVDILKLLSPVLGIDGSGKIDLGGQSLDIRLATAIDKSGQGQGSVVQLNGIPVPVRLSGSWNALKVTPDFSGVQSALQAELTGRLQQELNDRAGGAAGAIIGNIIGGKPQTTPPATPAAPTGTPTDTGTPAAQPETPAPSAEEQLEEAAEKAARDALGNLFGRRSAPKPAEETPDDGAE
ncbi:AsmA family protein [Hyphomonas neptunium ATCC 15444]|uniref:AsmA family protein n=2 Tax=Hyphomonas TaxID=85 RepID=Q0C2A2_HYPNA|nr:MULTISPECIES: AsmA family protein [Hyphomonas]ABI77834.1 AsmA family protein [Hyphomonas neptunium ATCC 15444]KCZ93145.1 AsmA family protein [Hyphomonas hirschiana VP5]